MFLKLHPVIQKDIEEICRILGDKLKKFEGMDILITGANGMLARYLVYVFLYANEQIFKTRCTLYLVIRNKKKPFGRRKDIKYIHTDIANDKLSDVSADYIIHAASKAAPKIYIKHMIDTLNTNIKGLYHILDIVSPKTKSILYFSSGEIYGNPPEGTRLNEEYIGTTDHLNERSCYVEGKKAGETICMNYFREKQYPIKIARIFHTFGPGLNLDDGRVFSDFINDGLHNRDIVIKGNKQMTRTFLSIHDATIMFFLLLLSDKNGEVFNISNDNNIASVRQIAEIIRDAWNKRYKKKIKIQHKMTHDSLYSKALQYLNPDISKFKKTFGYTPNDSIERIVEKTIQSLDSYET